MTGPAVIPVIHYLDDDQAMRNARHAFEAGCDGVFVIEMSGRNEPLPDVARAMKSRWPNMLVGMNMLGMSALDAVNRGVANGLDMTWTDTQLTHSMNAPWKDAERVRDALSYAPGHLLFSAVAFKYQDPEPDPERAALLAIAHGFVPTTSGAATGTAAETAKIAGLRSAIGKARLAIASGITPENAGAFAADVSHVLVATGVSLDFHEFDPARLAALMEAVGRSAANAA